MLKKGPHSVLQHSASSIMGEGVEFHRPLRASEDRTLAGFSPSSHEEVSSLFPSGIIGEQAPPEARKWLRAGDEIVSELEALGRLAFRLA